MANILLIGSSDIVGIPQDVLNWLYTYTTQGHKFIVGDSKGCDRHFHKALSSIGALNNSMIYCMDVPTSNVYDLPVKSFRTEFNQSEQKVIVKAEDNSIEPYEITDIKDAKDIPLSREWYEFRDRQMIKDCNAAIVIISNTELPKRLDHMITLLNISNKPCYIVRIA